MMKKIEEDKLNQVVGGEEVACDRGGRFNKGDRVVEWATAEPGTVKDCAWDPGYGIWKYYVVFDCGFEYWLDERDIGEEKK